VEQAFFEPLKGLASASPAGQFCPLFSDEDFVRLGVQRVLENSTSGRGFLQEHGLRFDGAPQLGNYFLALRSPRRCQVLVEVSLALISAADQKLRDRLADMAELSNYQCFAADGHWHKAAAHDPQHKHFKMPVGHIYSLNLRTHTLRHLAAGEGLRDHDLTTLRRIKPKGLRQGVPKGKRVLIVYDKACLDLTYWKRCRQECAVYFITRLKGGMVFDWLDSVPVDRADPRNHGVGEDRRVLSGEGHRLRIVHYTDPRTGESYEFLTNELDLPAAVIVELYRRRWEAEKVFDEIKNKLGEKKAWATSLEAKKAQAQFIALTHNLLLLYEQMLESEHGVTNQGEDQRRQKRMEAAVTACRKAGQALSTLVVEAQGATQRSVKFIRWVRQAIRDQTTEALAVLRLARLYATL
jgi:hypothetical protein